MGLFNWLMKGMNNEDDEDSVAERKVVEKERKKGRKKDKDIAKDVEQQSAYSQSSFAADPDQFNTAGRFENEYGQQSLNMGGYGTKNVVFFYPKDYQDIQKLVDFLKQGESAILNLDGINDDEAQRMLDFVSGAVYALNGSTQRVSGNIFLLTPEGLNIMVPKDSSD